MNLYNKLEILFGRTAFKGLINILSFKKMVIQLDITNSCNLRCKHCYHPGHEKGTITMKQWKNILDEYQSFLERMKLDTAFTICGGEPLTSNILFPILKEIRKRWPHAGIFILSNGVLIDQQLIEKLMPYKVSFQVSLDGADSKLHDLTRGPGNFNNALRGIKLLVENGISVSAQSILSLQTSRQIGDFFKLAKKIGVKSMNFTRLIMQGRANDLQISCKDRPLSPAELKKAYEDIWRYSDKYEVNTNKNHPLSCLLDNNTKGNYHYTGLAGFVIDYKGNMKVTSRSNYVLGNIIDEGLEKLFLLHPIMKRLRKGDIEGCKKCKHLQVCGGDRNAAYAEKGSFFEKDPGCWNVL